MTRRNAMTRHQTGRWHLAVVAVAVCAVGVYVQTASAADDTVRNSAANAGEIIYCYDLERDIVQRKLVGDCAGEIVTPERATAIRAAAIERRQKRFATPQAPVIDGRKLRSVGSGFFVTRDGMVVTNNHVVDGCSAISVETPDGRKAEASLVDVRPQDDLALIRVPLKAAATAAFLDSTGLKPGEPVAVIGYPVQGLAPIKPLITRGELGEGLAQPQGPSRFGIKADVRPGNSGGPVVDARALVIGVVYAKVNTVAVFRATGETVRFVGAVIDNRAVLSFLDRNNVAYRIAAVGDVLDESAFERELRALVARVGCWK
jgi:S1-C subfamily serine protease